MTVLIAFIAGIIGTMVMTLFSHIMELVTQEKFNEAQLINILISRSHSPAEIGENHYFGWVVHFLIGVMMSFGLWLYYSKIMPPEFTYHGVCIGLGLGILGVFGWSLILNFHSNPPQNRWVLFFGQLIIAHIIFSMTATWFLTAMDF